MVDYDCQVEYNEEREPEESLGVGRGWYFSKIARSDAAFLHSSMLLDRWH